MIALALGWSTAHPVRPMMVIEPALTGRVETSRMAGYGRQNWTIRNVANSPLRLRTHFTSGRSGFSLWLGQEQIVAPGASFVVSLTWVTPQHDAQSFSNHAEVWTNDPDRPKIQFKVVGRTNTPR